MGKLGKTPKYAKRLVLVGVIAATGFFGGLELFVPEGSKLTGSYDAASLKYIAAAPVSYADSKACGNANCHDALYADWLKGAHGANATQSKCEVCHGPRGSHPDKQDNDKIVKIRGYDNVAELCLSCHLQLKARLKTGQPQIIPKQHPFPNDGSLICTQCHNPHSPAINKPVKTAGNEQASSANEADSNKAAEPSAELALANGCYPCHGQSGKGGFAPQLAGQSFSSLKEKLTKIKSGELNSATMKPILSGINEEQIDTLAHYFSDIK